MCRVFCCVVGRGCFLWPVHSLGKTLLAFALLHSSRPNFPVTPGISWLPTFSFQFPTMKRHFVWVLVLEGPVGLHRTTELMLLQHYWLGHRLGLLWYWMVCLGNEQRPFCHFWDCTQVLHFGLFCWLWGQEDCLPSEPQGKPNTINGKREIFLFVFTELVCFCFLWAQEKQNWRNSRQYEYVYKCSCGLVSDRRLGVQNSGKTQD